MERDLFIIELVAAFIIVAAFFFFFFTVDSARANCEMKLPRNEKCVEVWVPASTLK